MNPPETSKCADVNRSAAAVPACALDSVIVRKSSPGSVVLTYGRAGLDRCRAVISQYGYAATLRVQLNYHALTGDEVDAAETAIAEIARHMVIHAATLRAANRPLFELVPHHGINGQQP